MAKIILNNKEYNIDDAVLASINNELKNHFTNVMNGFGATIKFGGATYGVDSGKLSTATANLATHLGTISGSGKKVVIGGVEYSVSSEKVAGAVAGLEAVFGELEDSGGERLEGDGQEFYTMAPQTLSFRSTAPLNELVDVKINGEVVDPSNYILEEGSTIVKFPIDYLQGLLQGKHQVTVESQNGSASGEFTVVSPELNEHDFYYNVPYYNMTDEVGFYVIIFKEDGTMVYRDIMLALIKSGSYVIENNNIVGELDNQPITFEIRADGLYSEDVHSDIGLTFTVNSLYSAVDNDYIYFFDTKDEDYQVCALHTGITSLDTMKSSIHDYPVTTLAWRGLEGCVLTDVVIPDNITNINAAAFAGCNQLRSVVIPDGVKNIDWSAFEDCTSLTDVEIGKGVTHIGPVAFGKCSNLKNVIYKGTSQQWLNMNFGYDAPNSFHKTRVSWVHCTDGRVSIFNNEVSALTPTKNEHGFYYNVPYTFSMPTEDDGMVLTLMMHVILKESGVVESYMSIPEMDLNGQPQGIGEMAIPYIYNNGTIIIPGNGEDVPEISIAVSDDGLSLIDTQGLLLGAPGAAFVCTFEDYHDIYFGATYKIHPALAGTDFQDMILNVDGSATDIYGNIIAPVGAVTYAPHTITLGELSGLVSMDGTTLFADGQPIWSTFDHICKFVNQFPNSEYLASEATCQSPAKYYYSCNCGAKGTETFEYGDMGEHNYVDTVCTVCGEVHDCDYTRKYQWDEYLVSEATCTQPAVYNYQCEHGVRGLETFMGDRLKPHNYVDTVCTVCGAKQPGLYETGSDYTVLLKTWNELEENDIVNEWTVSDTYSVSATSAGKEAIAGDLVLPNNATQIGNINGVSGFENCDQLTGIIIPDSVTSMVDSAFSGCDNLVSATIGNGVTSISRGAFWHCAGLKSLTIGSGVAAIGEDALRGCITLENIIVDAENPIYHSVDNSLIETATGTLIKGRVDGVIPENCGITSIGDYAFYDGSFANMIIPNGVTSIGESAFEGCDKLTNLVLPEGLETIGRCAFESCVSLKDITIPNSVINIDYRAFANCGKLASIIIPNGVTTIGEAAFQSCYNLKSITIGGNVTHIGEDAFNYCGQIASITFNGTMAQWRAISKGASWYSTTLTTYVQCTDGQVSL